MRPDDTLAVGTKGVVSGQNLLPRGRLLDKLVDARGKTLVVIQGPAGSGKTALGEQWRSSMLALGYDFAWLALPPEYVDPGHLLEGLFASLDRTDPALGREAAFILNRDGALVSADAVAIALIQAAQRHAKELYLLVDDYQSVSDPVGHQFFQTLVDFAPPNLHLALLSRSAPGLSLARLRDKDQVAEFGFDALRFSFSEVEQYLKHRHPQVEKRTARLLYDLTDGWIAGLQLAAIPLDASTSTAAAQARLQNAADFAAFFNRHVFAMMDGGLLADMTRLSAAKQFCASLCAVVFGPAHGQALLARLRRENLFLMSCDGDGRESWHRFHPLLRELLMERFRNLPSSAQVDTHHALADWFGEHGQLQEAVSHALSAGREDRAAFWLERDAPALFLRGKMRSLVSAVALLPLAARRGNPALRVWEAWAHLCYRRFAECRASVAELEAALGPDDTASRAHLTLLKGSLAVQEDDTDGAAAMLAEVEALSGGSDAILIGGRRNILSWLYAHQGKFEHARALQQGPRPVLDDGAVLLDSALGALTGQCIAGFTYLQQGNMRSAEQVLRAALEEAEGSLGMISDPACIAAGYLGDVLYEVNDIETARSMLELRIDLIERVSLPDSLLRIGVVLARIYAREGSYREALSHLDRLDEQVAERGLERALVHSLAERCRVLCLAGDMDGAEECLAQLTFMTKRHGANTAGSKRPFGMLLAMARTRWLVATDRLDEALRQAQDAYRLAGTLGFGRIGIQMRSQAALLLAQGDKPDEALPLMAQAMHDTQELGCMRVLMDYGPALQTLGDRVAQADLLSPVAAFYWQRLKAAAIETDVRAPARDVPAQIETLSAREFDVLQALACAMPNKRIARVLGISPETVKWHLKNVYGKLGVLGRDEAVLRARHLGLIDTALRDIRFSASPPR
jgi:LuxR family maltose regulon positive regulatory protein